MARFIYAATFEGSAAPADDAGTELNVHTRTGALTPLAGSKPPGGLGPAVQFKSVAVMSGDGTFGERGTIDFGDGNAIHFSELTPGSMGPASDGRSAGAIAWKVDSGTGIFQGASGYITSNFIVGEGGDVMDHQLGAILLP